MAANTLASRLAALAEQRFTRSISTPEAFFAREEAQIARACWAMARRFHDGGRLFALGHGAQATDAQHVAVEFVHPVIVGKRALPALALTPGSLPTRREARTAFAHQLRILGRPQDIAMGFAGDRNCVDVVEGLAEAKRQGLLTLALVGGEGKLLRGLGPDFLFVVASCDPLVVQETHETLYHILWELVHIFFEHEGLLVE